MAEDHCWYQFVVHFGVALAVEQAFRELTTSFNRHGSQFDTASHDVTHTVDTLDISILVFIDLYIAMFRSFNACCRQIDFIGGRVSADSPDQDISIVGLTIFKVQRH